MDADTGFTVRLKHGSVFGTLRVTFLWGSTWIATFHTCGDTVGPAVTRRGHEGAEEILRPRVPAILHAYRTFLSASTHLANGAPHS